MSAFHLWVAFVGPPEAYVMRGTHLAFALVLAFLVMPGLTGRAERPGWFGWALVLAAAACALYPSANLEYIRNRMYYVDDPVVLLGEGKGPAGARGLVALEQGVFFLDGRGVDRMPLLDSLFPEEPEVAR